MCQEADCPEQSRTHRQRSRLFRHRARRRRLASRLRANLVRRPRSPWRRCRPAPGATLDGICSRQESAVYTGAALLALRKGQSTPSHNLRRATRICQETDARCGRGRRRRAPRGLQGRPCACRPRRSRLQAVHVGCRSARAARARRTIDLQRGSPGGTYGPRSVSSVVSRGARQADRWRTVPRQDRGVLRSDPQECWRRARRGSLARTPRALHLPIRVAPSRTWVAPAGRGRVASAWRCSQLARWPGLQHLAA
jgi:hypothetical protein